MPKIKLTKGELKHQRDSLKQFSRFLPTLQLKKQQLQMEMRRCAQRLEELKEEERVLKVHLDSWIALFATPGAKDRITGMVTVGHVKRGTQNIAGVEVPTFISAEFTIGLYDLFIEDSWLDDALEVVKQILSIRTQMDIVEEQNRLLSQELRVTTQRVNLFEKVKIPECKESIRVIQIYLGDQFTAAVGRAKIAKSKMQAVS